MARLGLAHGCAFLPLETPTMTNWHDECADAFLKGSISVS
jgi:hypothetical protein